MYFTLSKTSDFVSVNDLVVKIDNASAISAVHVAESNGLRTFLL